MSLLCCSLPKFKLKLPRRKRRAPQEPIPTEKGAEDGPTPADTLRALEHELAEEKDKVVRLMAEAATNAEARRKLEDENKDVKEFVKTREAEIGQRDTEIQRLEKDKTAMREKLAQLQGADVRAQELTVRLAEREKLLSDRTTELNAAQAFLTKVDAVSEAEVVGMVDNLNTLICSASGALSDTWDQRDPIPGTLIEDADMERIRIEFGDLVARQIAARDTVAVNLAIQMQLSKFIEGITSGWGSGQAAGSLAQIYGMISTKESQTVASRWRSLTKRYTPHQELPPSEEVINGLAWILLLTQSFSDFSEAVDSVRESAGTEIKAIIESTVELDETIKTKISSSDMFVYIVQPGTSFSTEIMDDEFGGDGSGEEPMLVAGTMEIGLFQRSGNTEKMLRNPKVILERDLVEAEGEKRE